ncbi:MAG: CHAT domain-containing protein [Oscillatoria sp. SIO1A7]|nr:CHAT domain-containing protein [Oscillatoria sp. SIO1A7]
MPSSQFYPEPVEGSPMPNSPFPIPHSQFPMPNKLIQALALSLVLLPIPIAVSAQPIVPAGDGTGTVVLQNGSEFKIDGGQISEDNTNLFHNFERFGLDAGQIANFQSPAGIENIFSRVSGGQVSFINGLIQVSGANSNLFLINPAGIIFGSKAQLNVPGDFTATTANGIGFGEHWLLASQENNWRSLVGTPSKFIFELEPVGANHSRNNFSVVSPLLDNASSLETSNSLYIENPALENGSPLEQTIVNLGNLAVKPGHNLTLLGGTVLNSGKLAGGNIAIAAVAPGSVVERELIASAAPDKSERSILRISQPGHLLSLDIQVNSPSTPANIPISPANIPNLLAGGAASHATGIQVHGDGTVELTGSGIRANRGDLVLIGQTGNRNLSPLLNEPLLNEPLLNGKNAMLSASNNLTLIGSELATTENLTILAGDTVRVREGSMAAAGNIEIRGDRSIDILALNSSIPAFQSRGNIVLTSNGSISGDARFSSGGNFSIFGDFFSFYDPIVSSAGDVIFGDYTGASLKIEAVGSITGININITQPDIAVAGSDPDIEILSSSPSVILRAGVSNLANPSNVPPALEVENASFNGTPAPTNNGIFIGNIATAGGPAILSASGEVITGSITTAGGDISATSNAGAVTVAGELLSGGGNVAIASQSELATNNIATAGGDISLTSNAGNVAANGELLSEGGNVAIASQSELATNNIATAGGDISLTSNAGNVAANGELLSGGGNVAIASQSELATNNIATAGGNISLTSNAGNIAANGELLSGGGNVAIAASGNIATNNISSSGGEVSAISRAGNLTIEGDILSAGDADSGNVTLEAANDLAIPSNIDAGSSDITLTGNEIDLTGNVSGTGNLLLQPADPSLTIAIGGESALASGLDLTDMDLAALQEGFREIAIGRRDGTGNITVASNVDFSDPVVLQSPAGAGAIIVDGEISLLEDTTIRFDTAEPTILNQGVITEGTDLAFGNIFLAADVTFSTGEGAGDIIFSGTIDGGQNLRAIAGTGAVEFLGRVGGSVPLSSLDVEAATIAIARNLNTSGNILLNGATTLTDRLAIETDNADIIFRGTLDSEANEANALTLNAGSGNIAFEETVGANISLGELSIVSAGNVAATSSIRATALEQLEGNVTVVQGEIAIAEAIQLQAETIQLFGETTAGATIQLNSSGGIGANNLTTETGDIVIGAETGSINVGEIAASGGRIEISSQLGNINPRDINSGGGDIALSSEMGAITANNIASEGGNVDLNSPSSNLTVGEISSAGGNISIVSGGDVTTRDIISEGGQIAIAIETGDLGRGGSRTAPTEQIEQTTAEEAPENGQVEELRGNIASGGGDIEIEIETGNINVGEIVSAGGDITLSSERGAIATEDINASGLLGGGSVEIEIASSPAEPSDRPEIQTGNIISSASQGNGGNVTLESTNNIEVGYIDTQGGSFGFTGGNVEIVAPGFFRGTGIIADQNNIEASISTAAGEEGGEITIRHGGGQQQVPFEIGDAELAGVAGALTTAATNTILPPQTVTFSLSQGNINIITNRRQSGIGSQGSDSSGSNLFSSTAITRLFDPLGQIEQTTRFSSNVDRVEKLQGDNQVSQQTVLASDRDLLSLLRIDNLLRQNNLSAALPEIELFRQGEFEKFLGSELAEQNPDRSDRLSLENIMERLRIMGQETGTNPAIVYVFARPERLELVLVTPDGVPVHQSIPEASRDMLFPVAREFRAQITNIRSLKRKSYLAPSQQLYQWLIAPLEETMAARGIDLLMFSMDAGLRSLPLAALHDGEKFLVQKYRFSLIPSLNLTDTRYQDIRDRQVLAMGASEFQNQQPLPAVPAELRAIAGELGQGEFFLNEAFTLENLKTQRASEPFAIVHLATHAEFRSGNAAKSYIQLWDEQLSLDRLRSLQWNKPPVELLVLSACRTALGDEQAELGFGGLAVQAGAKSALASLWYVSDEGTLALMTEFYRQLRLAPNKAEALRLAQIEMLSGRVLIENGEVKGSRGNISLPPELANISARDLSHPYYWAAFTAIGSPF